MEILIVLFWWLFFLIVTPWVATAKGRSGVGWFLAALFFPLLALIVVALLPSVRPAAPAAAQFDDRRPCPECAEMILRQAKKCRFCGAAITPPAGR